MRTLGARLRTAERRRRSLGARVAFHSARRATPKWSSPVSFNLQVLGQVVQYAGQIEGVEPELIAAGGHLAHVPVEALPLHHR